MIIKKMSLYEFKYPTFKVRDLKLLNLENSLTKGSYLLNLIPFILCYLFITLSHNMLTLTNLIWIYSTSRCCYDSIRLFILYINNILLLIYSDFTLFLIIVTANYFQKYPWITWSLRLNVPIFTLSHWFITTIYFHKYSSLFDAYALITQSLH